MSVWTSVETEGLKKVKMLEFKEALKELELELDSRTEIQNLYGSDTVDYGLTYKGMPKDLGIRLNADKDVTLVGDTYRSDIVGDNSLQELSNLMNQRYQKVLLEKRLKREGWRIKTTVKNGKIVLDCKSA